MVLNYITVAGGNLKRVAQFGLMFSMKNERLVFVVYELTKYADVSKEQGNSWLLVYNL